VEALVLKLPIVIGVAPDSEPDDSNAQRTVTKADSNGVEVILSFEFLELQAWVRWIAPKPSIRLNSGAANFWRQILKRFPKPASSAGLNQISSSRGRVSPRESSASASCPSWRSRSRLAANL